MIGFVIGKKSNMAKVKANVIEIKVSYAVDDSCRMLLYAKGYHPIEEFVKEAAKFMEAWDERDLPDKFKSGVRQSYWRTVPANRETRAVGVCDFVFKECKAGRGAYPVTLSDHWLRMHEGRG